MPTSRKRLTARETFAWWVIVLLLFAVNFLLFRHIRSSDRLPVWAAILVLLPGVCIWMVIMLGLRFDSGGSPVKPRKFETLVGLLWAVLLLEIAIKVGAWLFLIHLYGYQRVHTAHLYFTTMPKGHPWIVSNGDQIGDPFLHFVISGEVWLGLFFVTYPFLRLLLPRQYAAAE